jgi:hypothetical protein
VKITRLVFTLIGSAVLTSGTAYADSSSPASQQSSPESAATEVSDYLYDTELAAPADGGKRQKNGNPSDGRRDRRDLSRKNHTRSSTTITKDRPKHLPNDREHSPSGNVMNFHQPGSHKRSATANNGLIQRDTVHSALPVRPARVARPTVPLRNNVRHRGANPAVIGGSVNSNGRNAGAINGTSVHRRP